LTSDALSNASLFDLDDRSASGTAFRAFWHLRRRLRLDTDVYGLADCEVDGSVRPVGDTNEKVRAIHRHHRSASPATLIMPTGIRDSERASMGTDNEWRLTTETVFLAFR
jgi:hypothetical protein